MKNSTNLRELALLFLKLGSIGFGGPAAHIAMMQQEVVTKRNWFSEQEFLDLIGITNLIPGPNSTELAIHIGHAKGGWKGLLVAGLCFILPAVLITGFFAFLYKAYGSLPNVYPFIYGIQPAILVVVLGAIFPLAKKSLKSIELRWIGVLVLVGIYFSINELILLFGAGIVAVLLNYLRNNRHQHVRSVVWFPVLSIFPSSFLSTLNSSLFWIFLKIGAILYGSGYVLFAFLDAELVARGLLTKQQLIDAIAVGQFTPGPVFSSVTFIGYQINGFSGAVVSTIAIFLPSFVFVAFLSPLLIRLKSSQVFASFLDAVNVASIALILGVCIEMGQQAIIDWKTILITGISLVALFVFPRLNSVFFVLGGSLLGYFFSCF